MRKSLGIVALLALAPQPSVAEDLSGLFHVAASAEDSGCRLLQTALEADPALRRATFKGRTLLHEAVRHNGRGRGCVSALLDSGAVADATDRDGLTPVMLAVLLGRDAALESFVKSKKGDVNRKLPDGRTALHIAMERADTHAIGWLLEAGANLWVEDRKGQSPIDVANSRNRYSLLTAIRPYTGVEAPSSMRDRLSFPSVVLPRGRPDAEGRDAVFAATAAGDADLLDAIIRQGYPANIVDQSSRTPLHVAIAASRKDLVEALMLLGLDPLKPDSGGRRPIDLADREMRILIENFPSRFDERHVLDSVLRHDAAAVHTLLSARSDLRTDDLVRSALAAASRGDEATWRETLDTVIPSPPTLPSIYQSVATLGNPWVLQVLLSKGWKPHPEDPLLIGWETPKSVAEALLDAGANPNAQDYAGRTALHVAAEHGRADLIEVFLARGADPNRRDLNRHSPLAYADDARVRQILEAGGSKPELQGPPTHEQVQRKFMETQERAIARRERTRVALKVFMVVGMGLGLIGTACYVLVLAVHWRGKPWMDGRVRTAWLVTCGVLLIGSNIVASGFLEMEGRPTRNPAPLGVLVLVAGIVRAIRKPADPGTALNA